MLLNNYLISELNWIKLTVLFILKQQHVVLVIAVAGSIFTPTSRAPFSSKTCTTVLALLGNKTKALRFISVEETPHFGLACFNLNILPVLPGNIPVMASGAMMQTNGHDLQRYTDEEVERCFEEFYEDVHTEFLKFGEIVNFKVCKNGSFHLRGNVYVQYKLLDSALLAYKSVNGRYFAGKQVNCKFVNLTRWKVAICGEYMKSGYKTCSHGTACNFIHCFRNPGGDYGWADSDKPPPKFWVKEMIALFGHSDDDHGNFSALKHSSNVPKTDSDRYHSRRSRSREKGQLNGGRSGRRKEEDESKQRTPDEEWNTDFKDSHKRKCRNRTPDTDSNREWLEEVDREKYHEHTRKSSFRRNKDDSSRRHEEYSDVDRVTINRGNKKQHDRKGRNSRKWNRDSRDWIYEAGSDEDSDRKRNRSSQRKGSRHHSRGNSNVTDESESDIDREHEEYSDADWDAMTRDNEKNHGSKGRNSQKLNMDSRYRVYEAGSDEDRHRKRHHSSQMKESRRRSRGSSYVIDESDKDRGEMETHDYSRESSRHRRSSLQEYCEDYENENDKIDGGWSQKETDQRAYHPEKKRLRHQKKLDSTNGDNKN
ncbi:zinc finger CCCH domain-containing protein 5-like, partial [Trifolium pratense]